MRTVLLSMGLLAFVVTVVAQGSGVKGELEAVNRRIAEGYVQGKADVVMGFYDRAATYLPEYKPTIVEAGELRHFFTDWFRAGAIKGYEKDIYSVEAVGAYTLEIGHFRLKYGAEKVYAGKYMIVWKKAAGRWAIVAEAFGAERFLPPGEVPYAEVAVKPNPGAETNSVSATLWRELGPFDDGVVKDVISGNGEGRAREFTEDGIYLPHFDPMQIGMEMLRPYMLRTYHPGAIHYVKNTYHEIFNVGAYVLVSGHFKVRANGEFEGNMLNLMKRGKDGKLLMWRQIAHN